jgi:hypothetical protein
MITRELASVASEATGDEYEKNVTFYET